MRGVTLGTQSAMETMSRVRRKDWRPSLTESSVQAHFNLVFILHVPSAPTAPPIPRRSASHLNKSAWNYCAIPIIFLFM